MNFIPFWEQNTSTETEAQAPIVANMAEGIGVDFSFFSGDEAKHITTDTVVEDKPKKKSKPKVVVNGQVMPDREIVNPIPGADVAEVNYAQTYNETTAMLRGAIAQTDMLSAEVKEDLDAVRASKTLKSKYTYITNLASTAASLISTKVNAIDKINGVITQAHNLELNRMKALKLDKSEENDDKKMMDIYSAFINTPIGTYTPGGPTIQDLTLGVNSPNPTVSAVEMIAPGVVGQAGPGLTPEQTRMRMESNPNIKTVVRYNQSTGQRFFDVVDSTTGMSIPNYPRPDSFLLEDTTIDIHSGIARNRNINAVWPLILEGSNQMPIQEY